MTTDAEAWDTDYTPAFRTRCYLTGLSSAFADGTRPTLDGTLAHAAEFPEQFARLSTQWTSCLHAASTINARYAEDWNQQGGALTVIAPAVRETALDELTSVWHTIVGTYVSETLDANRAAWDCPFCGVPVDPKGWFSHEIDADRCPHCYVILWMRGDETDWTNTWDETH